MDLWSRCDAVRPFSVEQATMEDISQQVEGVVLAAGLSSRSGLYKMALPLGDKTLIEHAVSSMYGVVDRVIVVGGHNVERIREILLSYSKVRVVTNEHFRSGMFSSVKEGLRHVRGSSFFLLPGDYPLVREGTYRRLMNASGDVIVPTYKGRKGHPVLIASHLIPRILQTPDTSTLRDFISAVGYVAMAVDDEGIRLDVDTLEDYERMRRDYEHDHQ